MLGRFGRRAAAFSLLVTAPWAVVTAQESGLTLSGFVVDSTFAGIPSVIVYLDSLPTYTMTDGTGAFHIGPVSPGKHRIFFRKASWSPTTYDFSVRETAGTVDIGLILLRPGPAPEASITGIVRDATTNDPIVAAEVLLNGTVMVQADAHGRFHIARRTVAWGTNLLTVRRIGYAAVTDMLWVEDPSTDFELNVRMSATAILMPEVVVLGDRVIYEFGKMREFWQRRRLGEGHFITREEIEGQTALDTSDLLRSIPGLRIERFGLRTRILSARRGDVCQLGLFVDGIPLVGDLDIDAYTSPDMIDGIEIYSGAATIPAQYNRSGGFGSSCGAIVVWTRN